MTEDWQRMAANIADQRNKATERINALEVALEDAEARCADARDDAEDAGERLGELLVSLSIVMDELGYPKSDTLHGRIEANYKRWREAMDELGGVEDELRDGMYVGDEEVEP